MIIKTKIHFEKAGYYFIGLVVLTLLGFWPTYFSNFVTGILTKVQRSKEPYYFHFHAVMMSLWISVLIVQPILIQKKKVIVHKLIGKVSYVIMPLLLASIVLLVHSRNRGLVNDPTLAPYLYVPFKDVITIGLAYIIAIVYRHNVNVHSRAMIVTGIQFIEPPLSRFMHYAIFGNNDPVWLSHVSYLSTIAIIYSIYIGLMIAERKQNIGRWVFPLFLGFTIAFHILLIFDVEISIWNSFAKWFVSQPLT